MDVLVSVDGLSPRLVCPLTGRGVSGRPQQVASRARTGWVSSVPVPPAFLREALSAAGLRPADLARWAAKVDPWVGLGALRLDRRWDLADRRAARAQIDAAFEAAQGVSVSGLASSRQAARDPAAMDALKVYLASMDALETPKVPPDLALALASSDEPDLRDQALLSLFDLDALPLDRARALMLAVDTAPDVREVALRRWCAIAGAHPLDVHLTPAEFGELRTVVAAEPDGTLAAGLALFGLTQARAVRPEDDALVEAWASLAVDASEQCSAHGPYDDLATSPPIQFSELPPDYQPDRFAVLAAGVHGDGFVLDRFDCAAAPCVAWFSADASVPHAEMAQAIQAAMRGWPGPVRVETTGWSNDRASLIAMPLPAGIPDTSRWLRWRAGEWHCPHAIAVDEARAYAGREPPPGDWVEALRAAVKGCWRSLQIPPSTVPTAEVRDGRWRFDADDPLWACTADQVGPPAPPDGARARVSVGFTGVMMGE